MRNPSLRHLQSLTSLRFLAALMVLVFHLSLFAPGLDPLGRLTSVGYVGVTFFFVLSGFVLTYSWGSGTSAGRFYRRRFARVYPVHVLFVVVAMLPIGTSPNWGALPLNLLLVQAWSPDDTVARSFSGVAWSLSCEFFFYAVFPLLARWLLRARRPLTVGSALLALAFVTGVGAETHSRDWALWLFHLPAFRIVEFACGSLAAIALTRGWVPPLRVRWAAVLVLTCYLAGLCLPVLIGYRVEDRWAFTLAMVPGFVALISACAHLDLTDTPTVLHRRTMVSLGEWSYCIYMAHPFVILLTRPLLRSASLTGAVIGCLVVTIVVIGVSFLLYTTFESPLERLLRGRGDTRVSREPMQPQLQLHGAPVPSVVPRSVRALTGHFLRSTMNRPVDPTSL
ncbi:acyltransferase [Terrabacter lapilli]|uniref:Acyltransferase n=1 Tax=Terrabacter lapilli TaxID=436231 RepID=A0ABN2STD1_9MICO